MASAARATPDSPVSEDENILLATPVFDDEFVDQTQLSEDFADSLVQRWLDALRPDAVAERVSRPLLNVANTNIDTDATDDVSNILPNAPPAQ